MSMSSHILRSALPGLALLAAGCASLPPDGGFGPVADAVQARTGARTAVLRSEADAVERDRIVAARLARPLTPDDAVQVALLNNPELQAAYAEVGIAQADLVQASRLRNPGFGFRRLSGQGDVAFERSFTFNLLQVLTLPATRRIEAARLDQVRLAVADQALRLAAATRRAWVDAVAAEESARYAAQVKQAAEAGAELGGAMASQGNWSKRDAARERSFFADAVATELRARRAAVAAREQLARLLGLPEAGDGMQLPDRLPSLPAHRATLADAEQRALEQRLDLAASRRQAESLAASLGLTRTTRWINVVDLGYVNTAETGLPSLRGYELHFELPLFDWGDARVARAEALYMQAVQQVAARVVRARSEVRDALSANDTAYRVAAHYRDEVVPLRRQIAEENLLRYNAMQLSVFELLADAREQIQSVRAYLDALRDYWLADADLQAALGGRLTEQEHHHVTPTR